MQRSSMFIEQNNADYENGDAKKNLDDDGRKKRTGTWVTASAHIITAVIGSGVLSLAWAIAQLGWVAGPAVLMIFSFITYFTSTLLADCYRAPDPVHGKKTTPTWMLKVQLCGLAQYANFLGVTIGYTITASISMMAVKKSTCFHKHGHEAKCQTSNNPFMIIFGCIQIILSQIQDFHELSWLSILASIMSFAYSSIGLGLSIAKVAGGTGHVKATSLTGVTVGVDVSASEKVWRTFQAIGDIAFAYAFSTVLVEIQATLYHGCVYIYKCAWMLKCVRIKCLHEMTDTLKSSPPENKSMRRASGVGVMTTTLFYVLCGIIGYATFGNDAPGNFLTGFGFYEPFWLIDFANFCIAVHLIGAYQVFAQPLFGFVEKLCTKRYPDNKFITSEHAINVPWCGVYYLNFFRLVWRTAYVVVTAMLAMTFPFFNDFLGLIGAGSFWPLTVYFPIEMHIAQSKIPKYSFRWVWLKIVSWVCLIVSLMAAAGSIQGLINSLSAYKPFQTPKELL
ncbi:Amino acid permease 6 [Hibiscus syriacus]|uniref:Amino acid permease 6 n=1 Tax=Hibiscus syriacus TaxID=106335 RepID=A0A6A3AFX1_HIBSY|nr:Amino acid permease 6 [Hibiscus syriacus]